MGKARKHGRFENNNRIVQRYRCPRCAKTFSEDQPLQGLRIEQAKSEQIIRLLCEGMGIRATARLVDCHRDTVLAVLETVGRQCAALLDYRVRAVKAKFVQADEIHTFVGCKQRRLNEDDDTRGDFYTFLSIDRDSKLVINWKTDKRTFEATSEFLRDLKKKMLDRFQFTTDGFRAYLHNTSGNVREVFHDFPIDYATEIKVFKHEKIAPFLFRPVVRQIKRQPRIGKPDMNLATTCHCERFNLSVRQFTKRFGRATLGYSKTLANLRHAVALFIAHFNYCRIHSAHKTTPAVAAKLTGSPWTIEKLLLECSKH